MLAALKSKSDLEPLRAWRLQAIYQRKTIMPTKKKKTNTPQKPGYTGSQCGFKAGDHLAYKYLGLILEFSQAYSHCAALEGVLKGGKMTISGLAALGAMRQWRSYRGFGVWWRRTATQSGLPNSGSSAPINLRGLAEALGEEAR
jgi:hypothetical protein